MNLLSKNITINKSGESEIEITAEIPAEEMTNRYKKALKEAQKNSELDGFRKGKVPLEMVEKNLGQGAIMQNAAESVIKEDYPRILKEKNISPLGYPQVTITKIAPDNDLGFKIKTAVMPKVELGDYKKIAPRILGENPVSEKPEVTEEELKETINNIRASHVLEEKRQKGEEVPSPESLTEEDLPTLTDEFVATLGEFSNVKDFNEKIKEHLSRQKKAKEQEKQWARILDAIIEKSSISLPSVLIESELDKMTAQLKDDIGRAGLNFEEYLTKIKKTEEAIRSEWRENAKKRAQTQLILNAIASKENIKPDPEIVEAQANHLLEHYKEAKPENVKTFVASQMTNEKTLIFLASLKGDPEKDKDVPEEKKKDKNDSEGGSK